MSGEAYVAEKALPISNLSFRPQDIQGRLDIFIQKKFMAQKTQMSAL